MGADSAVKTGWREVLQNFLRYAYFTALEPIVPFEPPNIDYRTPLRRDA